MDDPSQPNGPVARAMGLIGQDPTDAMREGIRSLLKAHYPRDNGVRSECTCGDWERVRGVPQDTEWSEHVAEVIAKAFPPATLTVTDNQAKVDELMGDLMEWAEGRRGFTSGDPARDAIVEAMEAVKRAAAIHALVQAEKAHG